jgi:hypothetical protein
LIKVREGKYKREQNWGSNGIWRPKELASAGVLKPTVTYWKGNQVIPIQ